MKEKRKITEPSASSGIQCCNRITHIFHTQVHYAWVCAADVDEHLCARLFPVISTRTGSPYIWYAWCASGARYDCKPSYRPEHCSRTP